MTAVPRPAAKKSSVVSKPPPPLPAKPAPVAVAPKTPLPPRPAASTKSTPPLPPAAKKPLPPRTASTPPPAPLVGKAPTSWVQPIAAAPPAPNVERQPQQPSQTDIDLPPYFEPRPPSFIMGDEDSDPDLLRRFQSDVVERRKRLTRIVATVVGFAWILCQIACARTIVGSVADAISSNAEAPPAKAAISKNTVAKDLKTSPKAKGAH